MKLRKCLKILLSLCLTVIMVIVGALPYEVHAQDLELQSPAAILMEASTGQIIYEKNADEQLRPASVTKVMTLLLAFEAIESGKISKDDQVTISEYAASMGGSQVYLEPGEVQSVNDLIKCISICSANDASVAMAEYIAGSELSFVTMMNERAKELGMNNTNFVNCCGLDADGHVTSARDIAIMSRELTVKHKDIFNYSMVWMDTITHVTKKGSTEFGLSNTNKLLKQYNGATGLKTGSTSVAKYSLSATATRDGVDLIAVIMAAPDFKIRFSEAAALLDYGFANTHIYEDAKPLDKLDTIPISDGKKDYINYTSDESFKYFCIKDQDTSLISKDYDIYNNQAPIIEGDVIGNVVYSYDGVKIGSLDIKATENIDKITYGFCFKKVMLRWLCSK